MTPNINKFSKLILTKNSNNPNSFYINYKFLIILKTRRYILAFQFKINSDLFK